MAPSAREEALALEEGVDSSDNDSDATSHSDVPSMENSGIGGAEEEESGPTWTDEPAVDGAVAETEVDVSVNDQLQDAVAADSEIMQRLEEELDEIPRRRKGKPAKKVMAAKAEKSKKKKGKALSAPLPVMSGGGGPTYVQGGGGGRGGVADLASSSSSSRNGSGNNAIANDAEEDAVPHYNPYAGQMAVFADEKPPPASAPSGTGGPAPPPAPPGSFGAPPAPPLPPIAKLPPAASAAPSARSAAATSVLLNIQGGGGTRNAEAPAAVTLPGLYVSTAELDDEQEDNLPALPSRNAVVHEPEYEGEEDDEEWAEGTVVAENLDQEQKRKKTHDRPAQRVTLSLRVCDEAQSHYEFAALSRQLRLHEALSAVLKRGLRLTEDAAPLLELLSLTWEEHDQAGSIITVELSMRGALLAALLQDEPMLDVITLNAALGLFHLPLVDEGGQETSVAVRIYALNQL